MYQVLCETIRHCPNAQEPPSVIGGHVGTVQYAKFHEAKDYA
jgi:hypothetical protein